MSNKVVSLKYTDTALPTGSAVFVLFNTAAIIASALGQTGARAAGAALGNWAAICGLHVYHLNLVHSHAGTLKGYKSTDRGATWKQFYDSASISAPAVGGSTDLTVPIEGMPDVAFTWTNGGTNQTSFDITQNLSDVP